MTFNQFKNAVKGYRKKQDSESKERLLIMRKIAYCSIAHVLKKGVTEHEFMPFEWEQKIQQNINAVDQEKILQEIEASKAFWKNYDEKKNKSIN